MEIAAAVNPEKGKPVVASALKPFNASTSLVLTLLFLVLWRFFYTRHFFGIRPVWLFIEDTTLAAGILGTLFMALSMGISLKRRELIRVGSVRFWMRTHLTLGLVGPALIELHGYGKNYGIAGWADLLMWTVALSGFVGMNLRGYLTEELKFRRGKLDAFKLQIDGQRDELEGKRTALAGLHAEIAGLGSHTGVAAHELQLGKGQLARDPKAIVRCTGDYLRYLWQTHLLRRRWRRTLRAERTLARMVARHTNMTLDLEIRSRTTGFVNELFTLWRLIHIPLTTSFVIALLVHLFTVWRY